MKLVGVVRLGRDAQLRYTSSGDPVAGFSGAWNYGREGEDGRKPAQWVELSLWGKRASGLAPYLVKGQQVEVFCSDVHIETFEKRDGSPGFKLVARVDDLELVGSSRASGGDAPRAEAAEGAGAAGRGSSRAPTAFDELADDIPF